MSAHHCHAADCMKPCKPEFLMCGKCWAQVPASLQAQVYATYRPGQCDDMSPSPEWHLAADAAIDAVAALTVVKAVSTTQRKILGIGIEQADRFDLFGEVPMICKPYPLPRTWLGRWLAFCPRGEHVVVAVGKLENTHEAHDKPPYWGYHLIDVVRIEPVPEACRKAVWRLSDEAYYAVGKAWRKASAEAKRASP